MKKIQSSKQNPFDHLKLELGIYLGFVIWDLEFCHPDDPNGPEKQ
jgi:hypothetical protein